MVSRCILQTIQKKTAYIFEEENLSSSLVGGVHSAFDYY